MGGGWALGTPLLEGVVAHLVEWVSYITASCYQRANLAHFPFDHTILCSCKHFQDCDVYLEAPIRTQGHLVLGFQFSKLKAKQSSLLNKRTASGTLWKYQKID